MQNPLQQMQQPPKLNFERFWEILLEFIEDLENTFQNESDAFEAYIDQFDPSPQNERKIIKGVLKPIKRFSKEILSHNESMFQNNVVEWVGVNFSELWKSKEMDEVTKFFIWEYLEDLYVIGNVILNPDKEAIFLRTVKHIKEKYPAPAPPEEILKMQQMQQQVMQMQQQAMQNPNAFNPMQMQQQMAQMMEMMPQGPTEAQNPANAPVEINPQQIGDATEHLKQMFAGNPTVQSLVGDIAGEVGKALQENSPQELMMSLMSGDKSKFGGLFEQMDEKYGEDLKKQNVDETVILSKASELFSQAPPPNQPPNFRGLGMPQINPMMMPMGFPQMMQDGSMRMMPPMMPPPQMMQQFHQDAQQIHQDAQEMREEVQHLENDVQHLEEEVKKIEEIKEDVIESDIVEDAKDSPYFTAK